MDFRFSVHDFHRMEFKEVDLFTIRLCREHGVPDWTAGLRCYDIPGIIKSRAVMGYL